MLDVSGGIHGPDQVKVFHRGLARSARAVFMQQLLEMPVVNANKASTPHVARNYKEATDIKNPHRAEYLRAIADECESHQEMGTHIVVDMTDVLSGTSILPSS